MRRILEPSIKTRRRTALPPSLSPREAEVLARVSVGLTNAQIAAELNTSIHAVKFHLSSVFRKLGVANRTQAAATYLREHGSPAP